MIRNVIFDMGQVLIRWAPRTILETFALTEEEKNLLVRELFGDVEWVQLDHGTISFDEAVERVCRRLPEKLHYPVEQSVKNWWNRRLIPVEGMADVVRQVKEAGCGIYLLSNAGITLREYFPRIPGSEYFDGLMISAEEKLLKPQHEIYYRLYDRFGLKPEECLFIDDSPANIEGAACTGMDGIVFRGDASRLLERLKQRNIL